MASAELSGLNMNLQDEEDRQRRPGWSVSGPEGGPVGETAASPVCYPVFYPTSSRDYNPYFPFSDSDSDAGSGSCLDSAPDPDTFFIDFFDRQSYEVDSVEEFCPDAGLRAVGDFNLWGFDEPDEEEEEIGLGLGVDPRSWSGSASGLQRGDSGGHGLRVTRIDSDSDYEDGVFDLNSSDNGNGENGSGQVRDVTRELGGDSGLPPVWDSFFDEEPEAADEEQEWEEVQNGINWTHEPSEIRVLDRPEEEEELSSSRISSGDDHEHDLDWQVLLAVNNVVNYIEQAEGINVDLAVNDDIDPDYYLYLATVDDYGVNHGDYDAIFGQMFDNETGTRGSPPAAKRVVEDLPIMELTAEELKKGNIVCAVCKDEIASEEKVRRLPCRHYYHGECILPWLGIRNTCPICRYELPTDDPEYERNRRRQRTGGGLEGESSVGYNISI